MNASTNEKAKRPMWIKILIGLGVAYLLYLIFGFLIAPIIMKNVLQGNVAETLDRAITVEKAAFNPFTLSVELTGLLVEDDKEKPFVEIGRLFVNPQLFPLLGKRISVKEFALADSVFKAEIDSSGELNFGRLLEGSGADEGEPAEPMHFTLTLIQVDNVRLELADYTRTLPLEESIGPISFTAENLKSDFDHDSPYHFEASFGDASTIKWTGGVTVNPIKSYGDISIQNIDISKAKPFWHDMLRAEIAGSFSFSGAYELKIDESGESGALKGASVSLDSVSFDDPEEDLEASFESLAIDGIEARWPENRVVIDSVALSGPAAQLIREDSGELVLPLKNNSSGESSEGPDSVGEDEMALDVLVRRFTLSSGTVDLIDRSLPNAKTLGFRDINLEATDIAPFDESVAAGLGLKLNLENGGSVEVDSRANLAKQEATGSLKIAELELQAFQEYVSQYANAVVSGGKLNLEVEYNYADSGETLSVESDLGLSSFEVRDSVNEEPILAFENLLVSQARYEDELASIASVALDKPVITVSLEESGLNLSRLAKPKQEEARIEQPEAAVDENADALPIGVKLSRFSLTDGQVRLVDRTLETAHQSSLGDLSIELENLSTAGEEPASIAVAGTFDRGGSIRFEGDLLPLDFKYNSAVNLDLSDFDLSATAPYWKKYLGRGLDKGMLNVEARIDIKESQLDGSNGILIDQLTLGDKVESEDSLGLPIGLAVAILKDREGKMELPPIKLSGDLDDPSVSISGIVMKALGNIIVKIATSPFAVLGNIAGAGGNEDLSKAPFETGKFAIEGDVEARLDKLAKILTERPGLKIEVFSVVAKTPESDLLGKAIIASRAVLLAGGDAGRSDPIVLLEGFDESAYEEQLKSVYRDVIGLVVEEVVEALDTEVSEETPASIESEKEPAAEEESGKGLLKNVARLLRTVTGQKGKPDSDSEEVAVAVEAKEEEDAEVFVPPVVELPSIEEIEEALFAREEFQVAASWLESLAQERANRVKEYLVATHGIGASRVFLSGETAIDNSSKNSLVRFDLTD